MSQGVDWSSESVLVTGGQGFVGSWLVERLLDAGAGIVVPRRDVPALSRFRMDGLESRCDVVALDILDYNSLLRVLNEYEVSAVFHLAAQTIVGTANRAPLGTFEANVRGTYTLLEACRTANLLGTSIARIVVASSDKAYGRHDALPYRESHSLRPTFPYDVSKACADMVARCYAAIYDLPVAVTRLANVYGGGDFNFSRIVPDTARALIQGVRPVIRSDGTPQRDYIHADDAVNAYLLVAESLSQEEMRGRAWNAGTGEPIAVSEIVDRLISASDHEGVKPEILGGGTPRGEIDRQYLDATAIRTELGWRPVRDLDSGLAETYTWYEQALNRTE